MTNSTTPIHLSGFDTLSLRQLDELNGLPKGSSFRVFKACEPELLEGRDYLYLNAQAHAPLIMQLKAEGRIYTATNHLLLLTRTGYARMREFAGTAPGTDAARPGE